MKHRAVLLLAIVLTFAIARAQAPVAPQLSDFAGEWKADFHKQTWLVLTLTPTKTLTDKRYSGEILTGNLVHATELSADDEGDITKVGDEMSTDKIVSVELQGTTLQIHTRDEDGIDDHYSLTLTGANAADLQSISSNGSPAPKAFKLKRTVAAPPTKK